MRDEHPDDKKAHFDIKREERGWKFNIWFWGFNAMHVMATRGKPRGLKSWNVNLWLERRDGKWVDTKFKDRWVIRYEAEYLGEPRTYWKKTYSPPGSARMVQRLIATAVRFANKKEAARWRAEGFNRSRDRRKKLDVYFNARKSLDRANRWVKNSTREYKAALALEKAFDPRGPRR